MKIFFVLAVFGVVGRLFYWQIYKGKQLSVKARNQYQQGALLTANRGNILSSDATWLAASGEAYLAFASLPELTKSPSEIAEKLAPFFVDPSEEPDGRQEFMVEIDRIKALLGRHDVVWVPLRQKVTPEIKKNIQALGIEGIGFEEQQMRVYPEASSAAHLLGFVGKDEEGADTGYFGLEGYYDLPLSSKPGFFSREADAAGTPILFGSSKKISAVSGVDLLTNIDKTVQFSVEDALLKGIEKYGASGGVVIVMNPKTGAILAASAFPSYDPSSYSEYGNEYFKDPAISFSFEPGSIFKVLVMAGALDAGAVTPETKCDICSGPVVVDKYTIETWNKVYNPDASMVDVIVHSDNVGMVFVAKTLGADRLYDYLDAFGIGKLTGIDLQGEMSPKLREKGTWSIVDLATGGFGQGVAVTPIQMVKAVAAIANDGILVTPRVVSKIIGDDWEEEVKPAPGERVISEKTASQVTAMMYEAAKKGEAKWTYLRGFKVAGKTGTAQIPISGHYDEEKTMASFVGFAPYDEPKFVMLVTLTQPTSSPWASETAAPLWYSIARDLFPYFGIQPE